MTDQEKDIAQAEDDVEGHRKALSDEEPSADRRAMRPGEDEDDTEGHKKA